MGDTHGRVGRVNTLAALTGRTVDVDADILLVDADRLDLVRLRVDEHAGRGGLDAALGFGNRHALDAVYAALEFEDGPGAVARRGLGLEGDGHVLHAAQVGFVEAEDLPREAGLIGEALVHAG